MRLSLLLAVTASTAIAVPADAQGIERVEGDAFTLGQIVVTAHPADQDAPLIGTATLGAPAIYTFNRQTLDDAVNLIPGVTSSNSGGSRNERLIFVRGFDRFQVPLSIDGIRVYLPADNRLDYGRFLTADIAEIQVAKGYASVLDGPGGMGGAINLVTRKPAKAIEAEAGATLNLDHDVNYAGYNAYAVLGTRHEKWYAQASFTRNFRDHWDLASGFRPTRNEDGSPRNLSRTEDWRVNAKIGFTPNATDEYSVSYTRQEGSKNAPPHITSDVAQVLRYWNWPEWNIDSVYFLSTTALGDRATVKSRAYYNEFYNLLRSFDNAAQNTQNGNPTFDSPYNDKAYGGSVQVDVALTGADTLSLAAHYRRDEHNEAQTARLGLPVGNPARVVEPNQKNVENTWSIAAENRLDLSDTLRFTAGVSYDWRDAVRAEEFTTARGLFNQPRVDTDGVNAQGRLDWTGRGGASAYASLSSRVRFPTIFERFSTQFNNSDPNPFLKPERATNFEIGGGYAVGSAHLTGAVYYSHLDDALVTILNTPTPTNASLSRRLNIGSADYYGVEIGVDIALTPSLSIGGNYSYIHRDFDLGTIPAGNSSRAFQLTDVPDHKGFAWASWTPVGGVTIVPNVEVASSRNTVNAASNAGVALAPLYYRTGSYTNGALRIDYAISPRLTLGIGGRNLFDQNVILTDGFPEPGRNFFASVRARY